MADSTGAAALDSAYRYLAGRPRSTAEVRVRLRRGGYEAAVIETVVARLLEQQLLDDAGFASYWVEQREQFKPRSARLLQAELRAKGVDRAVTESAIEAVDDVANGLALARPRWERTASLDPRARRDRLTRWLATRGYSWDTITTILRHLTDDEPAD